MTSRRTTLAWLALVATAPISGYAHAGAYEEHVPVRATGDAHAPITFRAAPGDAVRGTAGKVMPWIRMRS